MTPEQAVELEKTLQDGVPFSLSLYRAICGKDVDIVDDYMAGRVPESIRQNLRERLDRAAILEWWLRKIQAQLDRIEAKLNQ